MSDARDAAPSPPTPPSGEGPVADGGGVDVFPATTRVVVVATGLALLATLTSVAGVDGLVLALPLVAVPLAVLAVRGSRAAAIAAGVACVAVAVASTADRSSVAVAAIVGVLVGASALAVPLLLAAGRSGGRLGERAGWLASTAYGVALVAALVVAVATLGADGMRSAALDQARSRYAPALDACTGEREGSEVCRELEGQRQVVLDTIEDHGGVLLAVLVPLLSLGWGATAAWVARWVGARAGAPSLGPVRPLREFAVDWPVAYLVAGGLVAMMVGRSLEGHTGPWVELPGMALAVAGGLLLAADGVATATRWLMQRGTRWPTRLALVVVAMLLPWVALPVLLGIGMGDLFARLRASDAGTISRRGPDG